MDNVNNQMTDNKIVDGEMDGATDETDGVNGKTGTETDGATDGTDSAIGQNGWRKR